MRGPNSLIERRRRSPVFLISNHVRPAPSQRAAIEDGPSKAARLPRTLEVLLGIVVLVELILPFFLRTTGVDGSELLLLVGQYSRLVAKGALLPRWVPSGFYGFGSPTFYFYPPIAFYLAALVRVLTGIANPAVLFHATSFLATIGSFLSARFLLKSLGSKNYQKNIGALLYTFAPYRLAELYSRSSITCHVAYAFLPLVWLGAVEIVRGGSIGRWKATVLLGVSSALIALTNIPLMLITAGTLALAAIVCWRAITWESIRMGMAALLIAAGLSAFHLFSILAVKPQTQLRAVRGVPEYLVNDLLHFGNFTTAYHEALIYLVVILAAMAYWKSKKNGEDLTQSEHTVITLGLAFTAFMLFLETPFLSWTVWDHLLILELTVGAERYYIQLLLFGAVFVGIARSAPMLKAARKITWVWVVGAILPAFLLLFNLHIFPHSQAEPHDPAEYLPRYTVNEAHLYLIRDHERDPLVLAALHEGDHLTLLHRSPSLEVFDATILRPVTATFHRFYWPEWHLFAGSTIIPSRPDSLGRVQAQLPAGHYQLAWKLEPTPMERGGNWISLITIFSLVAAAGMSRVRTRQTNRSGKERIL